MSQPPNGVMPKLSITGLAMAAIHVAIVVYTLAQIFAAGAADWTFYWTTSTQCPST